MELTKICISCNEKLPVATFPFRNKLLGIRHGMCKECNNKDARSRYWENPEKYRALSIKRNKERHGISSSEYDQLLIDQNYKCFICHKAITRKNAHLDHDHNTGKLRKFLCGRCNVGIGMLGDSSRMCMLAAKYLMSFGK